MHGTCYLLAKSQILMISPCDMHTYIYILNSQFLALRPLAGLDALRISAYRHLLDAMLLAIGCHLLYAHCRAPVFITPDNCRHEGNMEVTAFVNRGNGNSELATEVTLSLSLSLMTPRKIGELACAGV